MESARRRLLAILGLVLVPWTVVLARESQTLFFPFGFVTPDPLSVILIWDYYLRYTAGPGSLPQYLVAYGVGAVLWSVASVSALAGIVWREDARITATMLVLAGASNLLFAWGFLRRPGYVAVPVGTLLCWVVVWWYYAEDFWQMLLITERDSW